MNCLWLTRQDPRPADSGELLYSLGLLRSLAGAGMDLTVLAQSSDAAVVPRDRTDATPDGHGIEWKFVRRRRRPRAFSLASHLPSDAWRNASGFRSLLILRTHCSRPSRCGPHAGIWDGYGHFPWPDS